MHYTKYKLYQQIEYTAVEPLFDNIILKWKKILMLTNVYGKKIVKNIVLNHFWHKLKNVNDQLDSRQKKETSKNVSSKLPIGEEDNWFLSFCQSHLRLFFQILLLTKDKLNLRIQWKLLWIHFSLLKLIQNRIKWITFKQTNHKNEDVLRYFVKIYTFAFQRYYYNKEIGIK